MEKFNIEKNVPIFKNQQGGNIRKSKYPWRNMEIGDSFFVELHEGTINNLQKTISSAAGAFRRNNEGMSFTCRISHNPLGIRVWRIK